MMKKIHCLTLISLFAVLVGCTEKSVVEKPSFSSYKNEVSFEDFSDRISKIFDENIVLSAHLDSDVPSFEAKTVARRTSETSNTRSGEAKTMSFYSSSISSSIETQSSFDSINKLFDYSGKQTYVQNEKYYNNEEITEIAKTNKRDYQLQNVDFEDGSYVATFNKNSHLLSESVFSSENLCYVTSLVASLSLFVDNERIPDIFDWIMYSETEQKYFKFYIDDNILTCTMNREVSTETKKVIKETEHVSSRTKKTETRTMQLMVGKNEAKYKDYIVSTEKIERLDYLDNYISTDTIETKNVKSTDAYLRLNDKISLKAENIDSYKEGRESVVGLSFSYTDL